MSTAADRPSVPYKPYRELLAWLPPTLWFVGSIALQTAAISWQRPVAQMRA